VGEEFGTSEGSRYEWVVDPIDGTRSFMAGCRCGRRFSDLRVDGVPRFGLVDQPYIGDRFWGGERRGLYARDRWGRTTHQHPHLPDLSQAH
jgi:fructose-1,6-bisphosphatase/inositol monophosphatase family enzyme